jgi:hypothetical protein
MTAGELDFSKTTGAGIKAHRLTQAPNSPLLPVADPCPFQAAHEAEFAYNGAFILSLARCGRPSGMRAGVEKICFEASQY